MPVILVADRIPWVAELGSVRERPTAEEDARATRYPPVVSRQHPDHDTDAWPPA